MKKMYANKPTLNTEDAISSAPENNDSAKRIKYLEGKVRHLSEQVNKMASALSLNSRQIRKQNTDINNVTTAVRSNK